MRDAISGKIQVPSFSERLADYEEDRTKFSKLANEFEMIDYQTAYVNHLGKMNRKECENFR